MSNKWIYSWNKHFLLSYCRPEVCVCYRSEYIFFTCQRWALAGVHTKKQPVKTKRGDALVRGCVASGTPETWNIIQKVSNCFIFCLNNCKVNRKKYGNNTTKWYTRDYLIGYCSRLLVGWSRTAVLKLSSQDDAAFFFFFWWRSADRADSSKCVLSCR